MFANQSLPDSTTMRYGNKARTFRHLTWTSLLRNFQNVAPGNSLIPCSCHSTMRMESFKASLQQNKLTPSLFSQMVPTRMLKNFTLTSIRQRSHSCRVFRLWQSTTGMQTAMRMFATEVQCHSTTCYQSRSQPPFSTYWLD